MDLPMIVDVLFGLMVVLSAAMVVYGGWLCWCEAAWIDEDVRRSGWRTASSRRPQADADEAAGTPAVREPMFNARHEGILLYSCIVMAAFAFVLIVPAIVVPTESSVSSAATTESTPRTQAGTPALREAAAMPSRASLDYFPANYVNRGRIGDGDVVTFEHD